MLNFKIIHYQHVSSTNNVMKEQLSKGMVEEGTVILADYQFAGRGRGDHSWYSEPGKDLLMSCLVKPQMPAHDHFAINEFLSLAIIDTLDRYDLSAKIKWPNDIYLNGSKLAGILIENTLAADTISSSVLGLGLNLNTTRFPQDVPHATSLKRVTGKPYNRKVFLNRLLENLAERYEQWMGHGREGLHQSYLQHVYALGQEILYRAGRQNRKGVLADILLQGEIVIQSEGIRRESYLFDEVQLLDKQPNTDT